MTDSAKPESCLHLVLSAGAEALAQCHRLTRPGDTLLFVDDGVRHLLGEDTCPPGCSAAWSEPCLAARGLQPAAQARGVSLAGDDDFARLLRRHAHCLSWT